MCAFDRSICMRDSARRIRRSKMLVVEHKRKSWVGRYEKIRSRSKNMCACLMLVWETDRSAVTG